MKHTSLLFCLVLGGLLYSTQAYAVVCDPTDNDWVEAQRVIVKVNGAKSSINSRITDMENAVVRTIEKSTAQISLYIKQQDTMMAKLADGEQRNGVQLARENQQVDIARGLAPQRSYCQAVSGLAGLSATEEISKGFLQTTMSAKLNRLTQDTGSGPSGRAVSLRARWKQIEEFQPEKCKNDEVKKVIDGVEWCIKNGDMNPALLFAVPTLDNDALRKSTKAYIDNLINPIDDDPMVYEQMKTSGDRLKFLEKRKYLSRLALAYYALLSVRANKMEAVKLGDWANAILPADMKRTGNLSKDDLYKVLASDRFRQPNYFTSLQSLTPENKKLEMLTNQSVSLMLQYEGYEQKELSNSLLSAILAQLIEKKESSAKLMTSTATEN